MTTGLNKQVTKEQEMDALTPQYFSMEMDPERLKRVFGDLLESRKTFKGAWEDLASQLQSTPEYLEVANDCKDDCLMYRSYGPDFGKENYTEQEVVEMTLKKVLNRRQVSNTSSEYKEYIGKKFVFTDNFAYNVFKRAINLTLVYVYDDKVFVFLTDEGEYVTNSFNSDQDIKAWLDERLKEKVPESKDVKYVLRFWDKEYNKPLYCYIDKDNKKHVSTVFDVSQFTEVPMTALIFFVDQYNDKWKLGKYYSQSVLISTNSNDVINLSDLNRIEGIDISSLTIMYDTNHPTEEEYQVIDYSLYPKLISAIQDNESVTIYRKF